ncbi:cell division protein FtsL [Laceyella sediminis]|jgi:cell division protein FtsL|uniref:Cell division protein FtsL n=1 Tax=Laceyella sediminis TaxID=573074 RepID=A0ABX5ETD1_9BACL|nr:cell division protein FtsL [Laceyella sediminis]PRZ16987.1 cell division protein FtsL [Laceyella sediminis]
MRRDQYNVAVARPFEKPYTKVRDKKQKAPRTTVTMGEKLLYLSSVIVCVALALVVLSKYAKVNELNVALQETNAAIEEAHKVNFKLETEKKKLADVERIRKFAESNGLELTTPKYLPSIRP